MLGRWAVCSLVLASCVDSSSVRCPDGSVCPDGTACATVDDETLCVLPDQIASCDGKLELDVCGENQRCYDGVCLAAGCGNGRVDPDEACDDDNTVPNDGCSADCLSDETCGNGVVDFVKREECDDGAVARPLSHDGCASDCTIETAVWQTVPPLALIADGAFAYDAKRDRLVLFGDVNGAQTWEWDGARWQMRLPRVSPVPRIHHAMAYDPVNEVVVMFGGRGTNDTWQWDGTAWTLRAPTTSPPGRSDHVMVTDARRKRIVMFGGQNAALTLLGDTWAWDGSNWTQLQSVEAPAARRSASLAYDPVRDVVVLYGGAISSSANDDQTWELAGSTWTRRMPANIPPARNAAGMAFDPRSKQIVMHGGSGGGVRSDTWLWNGTDWSLHPVAGPALAGHYQTTAQREGYVVALDRGKTFRWNAGWIQQEDGVASVPPRFSAAGAVDLAGRRVMLHGGTENTSTTQSSMIWTGTWQRLSNSVADSSPGRVSNAAMTYDAGRRQFVHFGGFNTTVNALVNDTWVFDTAWAKKTPATLPAPRLGHVLVYDAARDRSVLFGGTGLDDTWLWDGTQWMPTTPASKPSAREAASAAYDPIRKVVVLFGGLNTSFVPFADTWEWDGTTWTPRLVPGPPARSSAGMAWDTARKRIVLFGGAGPANSLNDQWEWDGQTWKQLPTQSSVKARANHVMVSALSEGGVLAFGGSGESAAIFNDLLWLHWDNDAVEELCQATDHDGDALAGCADGDCWRVCKPDCPPGMSCMAARGCGDGTCDPITESCTTCAMDCTCVASCGNFACEAGESAATCPGDCP